MSIARLSVYVSLLAVGILGTLLLFTSVWDCNTPETNLSVQTLYVKTFDDVNHDVRPDVNRDVNRDVSRVNRTNVPRQMNSCTKDVIQDYQRKYHRFPREAKWLNWNRRYPAPR